MRHCYTALQVESPRPFGAAKLDAGRAQVAKRCRIHRIDRDINMRVCFDPPRSGGRTPLRGAHLTRPVAPDPYGDLAQQDSISFLLFLHRGIHPSVAKSFVQLPEQVNRSHGLFTHNTKTPDNRPYIQGDAPVAPVAPRYAAHLTHPASRQRSPSSPAPDATQSSLTPFQGAPARVAGRQSLQSHLTSARYAGGHSTPSIDNAVVYVAFHQFFSTQKYIAILALKVCPGAP